MNRTQAPARVPNQVYSTCAYFLPRVTFLNSTHAAQVSWGDIAIALADFPDSLQDLSSADFWEEWMRRWKQLGDDYTAYSNAAHSSLSSRRLFRTAAACYHWAEFMYFTNSEIKRELRSRVKECFKRSLDVEKLNILLGEIHLNSVQIPYYLVLPGAAENQEQYPCIIMSNGLDSVTEVEIFALAEPFLTRGIAVFMFDGPGQGINLGRNAIEYRFENVVESILSFLSHQSSIQFERLGFFGISFGGYLALRVAKYLGEKFRCVVNYSGGPSLAPFKCLPRRLKEDFQYAFMEKNSDHMQDLFDTLTLDMSGSLRTEVLSIHGALDDIFPIEGLMSINGQPENKHTLHIYPTEAHVCLNYLNRNSIIIADWAAHKLSVNI